MSIVRSPAELRLLLEQDAEAGGFLGNSERDAYKAILTIDGALHHLGPTAPLERLRQVEEALTGFYAPRFSLAGTVTGRVQCAAPNPTKAEWESFRARAPERCPACGKDVALSRAYLTWACTDPACRHAHGPPPPSNWADGEEEKTP